jgi:hypothetical protein
LHFDWRSITVLESQLRKEGNLTNSAFALEESPAHYAGIEDIKRTFHASPMSVYLERYLRGGHGTKSTERETLVKATAQVKNCSGRVLAFLVSLCRQGFDGMLCPLDVISERLKRATGGKGEPRTIRRCLITLEQLGYIHRAYHRTGSQIMTPKGLLNLQVLRITFTPLMLQVLGFVAVTKHRPKRPLLPRSEPRINQTIGRSGLSDGVTSGQTKKEGNQMDERDQLTPARAVAHTSLGLLTIAAMKDEASQELDRIYQDEESEPKRILKAVPPPEKFQVKPFDNGVPPTEKERLGSLQEFLSNLYQAVSDYVFANNLFRVVDDHDPKKPIDVLNPLLIMCQNQNSVVYPASFPRVHFDLMHFVCSDFDTHKKIIKDYVEALRKFREDPKVVEQTMRSFPDIPGRFSYSPHIAVLCVLGKIKIADISENYLKDFPK